MAPPASTRRKKKNGKKRRCKAKGRSSQFASTHALQSGPHDLNFHPTTASSSSSTTTTGSSSASGSASGSAMIRSHHHSNTNSPTSTQLSSTMQATMMAPSARQFKIFCDLDGVLVDFCAGVEAVCGARPEQISKSKMWRQLATEDGFYSRLPWMKDGKRLWETIRHLNPDILTGVPMTKKSRREKAAWCQRELFGVETNHVDVAGPQMKHKVVSGKRLDGTVTNVITCWSKNKHHESSERSVLIDDRLDLKRDWVSKGGIFVHHVSTERTLQQLKEYGIISD